MQPQVLTEVERVRRSEYMLDTKAALQIGVSHDEYVAQRDQNVEKWCQWLHAEMDRTRACDPTEILPQIAVRIEQHAVAEARKAAKAAARETVQVMFAKAIK